jgi:hypothetical protein
MFVPGGRGAQAGGMKKAWQNRLFSPPVAVPRQGAGLTGRRRNPPDSPAAALPASPDDFIASLVPGEPEPRPAPIV